MTAAVWPFTRKPVEPSAEALAALAEAERANRDLDDKLPRRHSLAEALLSKRTENHFGPDIAEVLRPRKDRRA